MEEKMKVQVPSVEQIMAWLNDDDHGFESYELKQIFELAIAWANEQLLLSPPTKRPFLSDLEIDKESETRSAFNSFEDGARWARDKYEARDRGGDIGHSAEREKILMQFIESEYRLRQEQFNELQSDPTVGVSSGEIDDGWSQLQNRIQTALDVPTVEPKWQPVFGMKCAFWNTGEAYTRTDLWVAYSSDFLTGMKVHKGQNHNHGQYCALLETLDEIGKPPSYFQERGRCTV
jgi:hypothetical protein